MYLNTSTHANETLPWTPDHNRIISWSILLVWSLLGNVLVISVVYCNQNLRTNMNYLIVNMAVSDLLVPLVAIPWMISKHLVRPLEWLVDGPLGEALCKLVPFLCDISPYVSSISLAIIAFQRFIVVVYPTRRHVLTSKARWILISISWIVAMALFSPYFYTCRLINEWGYTMCYNSWSPAFDFWPAQMIFGIVVVIVGFTIPLFVMIMFYTIIRYKLRKALKNVIEMLERETIRLRQRRNRRILHMSITIVVMFTVGWIPLGLLNFLFVVQHPSITSMDNDKSDKLHYAFVYLWYLQAAINPCIYFLFLRDFRQGLKTLKINLCCQMNEQTYTSCVCCANNVVPSGGDSNQLDQTCTPPHINTTSV